MWIVVINKYTVVEIKMKNVWRLLTWIYKFGTSVLFSFVFLPSCFFEGDESNMKRTLVTLCALLFMCLLFLASTGEGFSTAKKKKPRSGKKNSRGGKQAAGRAETTENAAAPADLGEEGVEEKTCKGGDGTSPDTNSSFHAINPVCQTQDGRLLWSWWYNLLARK